MTRVLLVSSQSSCRNMIAQSTMKKLVQDAGFQYLLEIDSAVTGAGHGMPLSLSIQRMMKKEGIAFCPTDLPMLQNRDYDRYDLLIGMDRWDRRKMYHICGGDFSDKIFLLLDFTGQLGDVMEPQKPEEFSLALDQIREGCQRLLGQL